MRETKLTQGYLVRIPASVRRELAIQPGDRLIWEVRGARLTVRVRKATGRAFDDFEAFEAFDLGEPTDATSEHDLVS